MNLTCKLLITIFVLSVAVDAGAENWDEETIVEFAIPIGQNLAEVLDEGTRPGKHTLSEMLQSIGIIFYEGSKVSLEKEARMIRGRLAHSQAWLVLELAKMHAETSKEEIHNYFHSTPECFPESKSEPEKNPQQ